MSIKKIKYLIIICLLFVSNILPVKADILDFEKTGTIELTLKESTEQTPIKDLEITIIEIASATSENHNLVFTYHENIENCEVDLSNLSNEDSVYELEKCIKNIELPTQTKLTDTEGKILFDELRLGIYLVKQTNEVEEYSNIDPFLVMIPEVEDNKWIYDIKAKPKTDIIRVMDITVEKIWNDSSNLETHPDSVTIELYKGQELIDTINLNEENNWTYTWNRIPKSDGYSVKEKNVPIGYTDTYRQENNKFIVTNTKTLVQTGINIIAIELLSILGILLILVGLIITKRKKYE